MDFLCFLQAVMPQGSETGARVFKVLRVGFCACTRYSGACGSKVAPGNGPRRAKAKPGAIVAPGLLRIGSAMGWGQSAITS